MIYETQDEAWNAILNDAKEYLSCFEEGEAVMEKCESALNVIVKNPKTGKTLCEWEPQCLKFSKDVNHID